MKNITADLVKELRLRTGSGVMDCKQALITSSGDINQAIINLRKNGKSKAEKKHLNITTRGLVLVKIYDSIGYIIELNCETDFVAQHIEFVNFAKEILLQANVQNIRDIKILKTIFSEKIIILIAKFNENIIIRRFCMLQGDTILSYMHGYRIGVLLRAKCSNKEAVKKIAMHIAASKPEYLYSSDIPVSVLNKEKEIQLELAIRSGKNEKIAKKIVSGRINKFINSIVLLEQSFVMDTDKTVKTFLSENNVKIREFIRFEVGERI